MVEELKERLADIDAALVRIADGTYGYCTNCKQMIDTDRLAILPTATLCLSCEKEKKVSITGKITSWIFPILYEDNDLLVVNKPPGVVVNRAQSVKGETIQDWAEKRLQLHPRSGTVSWGDTFESRAGIAHRIDKETSGVLVIAKNPPSFISLQAQFKEQNHSKNISCACSW